MLNMLQMLDHVFYRKLQKNLSLIKILLAWHK